MRRFICCLILLSSAIALRGQTPQATPPSAPSGHPVHVFVYERARGLGWEWFKAPPDNIYGYGESLLRFGLTQTINRWDWRVEITQGTIIDAPNTAVSSSTAQGQLGLGASYYVSGNNNSYPAAAFLKQGYVRYGFDADKNIRIGSDSHFCFDQPAAAASFISSRVATFLVFPASRPRKLSILPCGRAALSVTAPSGCFSNSIFSPGLIPRCCSTSLRKVTWPRSVTVKVFIRSASLAD